MNLTLLITQKAESITTRQMSLKNKIVKLDEILKQHREINNHQGDSIEMTIIQNIIQKVLIRKLNGINKQGHRP